MGKDVIVSPLRWVQRIVGFCIGFFFAQPTIMYLTDFLGKESVAIPELIPNIIAHLLIAGGSMGIILLLITILLGIKLIAKLLTFVCWIVVGLLLAELFMVLGFPIPNLYNWIISQVNLPW